MSTRGFTFIGGDIGPWFITKMAAITGESLPVAKRLEIVSGFAIPSDAPVAWALCGITSNERYVTREEKEQLVAKQQGVGRPEATCAALLPLRKNALWWALTQDERRDILEKRSKHINIGLRYLPAIARRLHHCRDLSEHEPFDFLTWFEYAPAYEAEFDTLVAELRASEEWKYVEREVDIRVVRAGT